MVITLRQFLIVNAWDFSFIESLSNIKNVFVFTNSRRSSLTSVLQDSSLFGLFPYH